jgi:glucosyl-3-phosphoglycerate phosphatase
MTAPFYIARHGETVFNAAARMQGATAHTPLTRTGFAQADAMGEALRRRLGPRPVLDLWASPTGRALQTLAVIAEHLELDWHAAHIDARLDEIGIGEWSGRYYHDVIAEVGDIIDPATGLFSRRAPGGEWYDEIAVRLQAWLDDNREQTNPRLVVMHGISSCVLRGMLTGAEARPECRAPVADGLPQGSVVEIEDGAEHVLQWGSRGTEDGPPTA